MLNISPKCQSGFAVAGLAFPGYSFPLFPEQNFTLSPSVTPSPAVMNSTVDHDSLTYWIIDHRLDPASGVLLDKLSDCSGRLKMFRSVVMETINLKYLFGNDMLRTGIMECSTNMSITAQEFSSAFRGLMLLQRTNNMNMYGAEYGVGGVIWSYDRNHRWL